jgi:hypothetical protein
MNYGRIVLAAFGALVAYMALGAIIFAALPALKSEFLKYPAVYRGSFVLHNYVNLNIGLRITVASAIAYFIEWTVVGIVIGVIYRPYH